MIIERNHLKLILTIHKTGSLTAAAESLHTTQSALSHALKKLEGQLDVQLFRRESRKLFPTQAGEFLLAAANRLEPQLAHVEDRLKQFSDGECGVLRIGMECYPCYQWLLTKVGPFLKSWPSVDIDIKQKFQFGGIGALFGYDIDMLVTPDPLMKDELHFEPVFDYEQVLVVSSNHPLANCEYVEPSALIGETLITYPVVKERLDIFSLFLTPAGVEPKQHKTIETTDVLLQMVASGRGVSALPRWLVEDYANRMAIKPVKLGKDGVPKNIYIGVRKDDLEVKYIRDFINYSRS